ncbi:hypothetical protein ES708_07880 [subsurface metagenome]
MEASFQNKLIEILKTDSRFIDQDGELVKAAIIDRAWKTDRDLVKLLLSDASIKQKFFEEIEGHWVFHVNTFIDYISDKDFLDNSYTRFRNKIGLNIDGRYLRERGEVCLVWPYKDCVLEGGQTKEEEKRKEIFFNEILAQDEIDQLLDPKVLTNWKRYTTDGEQKVSKIRRDEGGAIKENLLIKGNNLLALHCLKHQFMGKVKLIYIDPPYNLGNDSFGYNDNFNHSAWLTFMKNRLNAAKDLLNDQGAIFISINHIELGYLLVLMDEIFDRENKLPIITLRSGTTASYRSINECPVNVSEYIVGYSKTQQFRSKPIYVESDYSEDYSHLIENKEAPVSKWVLINLNDYIHASEGCSNWREFKDKFGSSWKEIRFNKKRDFAFNNPGIIVSLNTLQKPSGRITSVIEKSKRERGVVHIVERDQDTPIYCYNGRTLAFFSGKFQNISGENVPTEILTNIWLDVSFLGIGPEGDVDLPNGKKPEALIKHLIDLVATDTGDIVMDFHLGSGTTCAVAHKMGRQYIGVEQLDYGENDSATRLQNVIKGDNSGISKDVNWKGGGEFVYSELMRYNESFIDKINSASMSDELIEILQDISTNSFLNWYINPEAPEDALNDFIEIGKSDNGIEKQKKLLCELLNKNQLYVGLSEIEDAKFSVSKHDKELNKQFYGDAYNA